MMQGVLASVTVGRVQMMQVPQDRKIDFNDSRWNSGIFKKEVAGKVTVRRTGLEGDEQADLLNHGGPDNVVLAYAAGHYPVWIRDLGIFGLPYGSFGENFTIEGNFTDETVCIGDVWRVGDEATGVMLQVSQPRQPCWKLARRLEQVHIVKMVRDRGWGGWYSRVLREGHVEAGMNVELVERLHPEWTCVKAARAMYGRKQDPGPARELAKLGELSVRWKEELVEL